MILGVTGNEKFQCPEGAVCIQSKHWAACMNIGVIVYSTQKFQLLELLEREYKNIVVSGDLFLDQDVRAAIVSHNGEIIEVNDAEVLQLNNEFFGKVVSDLSIEDSIKKAMAELGLDPEEITETPEPEKMVQTPEVQPTEPEKTPEPEPEVTEEFPPNLPNTQSDEPEVSKPLNEEQTTQIKQNTSIYLKIKDGTVALFIPEGAQLGRTEVGGESYSTIVFRAPDLGNTGLQELVQVAQAQPVERVKRVPISSDSSLIELVREKSRLDEQIKSARQSGDEVLVKQLRKQRRQVREQINYWGFNND